MDGCCSAGVRGEVREDDMARTVLVPYAPSSVTSARQRLCTELEEGGLDAPRVNDAALVLSELLSNALRHASPLPPPFPPDSVQVAWDVETAASGRVRLEIRVRDGGASTLPRIARPSPSALGGRGLGIVEHLARRWGTEVDGSVTTVWAVLELGDGEDGAVPAFVSSRTRVMSG
ncbi:ATP-binding protein [Nocardiopsis suaedae]|uniref:ATP-binding protein n=1 Tax=Nocardiopsis suaedae TaxID=3018444 RepID=A0ABT4TP90_9ACTN|nr:ATP-binding protein [Nocardiopsis suaedae]MDA2806500.1 ATP-binding protein [Nocardiopsis suaedae]